MLSDTQAHHYVLPQVVKTPLNQGGVGCMVFITKEINAKVDTLSLVNLFNLWSIIRSNVKGMTLVVDNIMSDPLTKKQVMPYQSSVICHMQ